MITPNFEDILLAEEQKQLLIALVEASRKQPRDRKQRFLAIQASGGTVFAGLEDYEGAYIGDVEAIINAGLLNGFRNAQGALVFDVAPKGIHCYEYLMKTNSEPVDRVEERVIGYLDATAFEKRHPEAYARWRQAEELLWGSNSQKQHTVVGHFCREAMQYFATSLIDQYQPDNIDSDIKKTKNRLKAVIEQEKKGMSDDVKSLLDALVGYWDSVNDLTQRQEHGAQKEGEALTWEDSRRLVFQRAIVMFEIDRALQDLK